MEFHDWGYGMVAAHLVLTGGWSGLDLALVVAYPSDIYSNS